MSEPTRILPDMPGHWYYQDDPHDKPSIALVEPGPDGVLMAETHGYRGSIPVDSVIFHWLRPVQDVYQYVKDFHEKFVPSIVGSSPRWPYFDFYGIEFINEEICELREAFDDRNMVGVADALADISYVVNRMAVIMGIDLRPVHAVVHDANMAKEGGETRADHKVLKPPGWVPPDVAGELRKQGWEG